MTTQEIRQSKMDEERINRHIKYIRKVLAKRYGISGDRLDAMTQECILQALEKNPRTKVLRNIIRDVVRLENLRDKRFRVNESVEPDGYAEGKKTTATRGIFALKRTRSTLLLVRDLINDSHILSDDERNVMESRLHGKNLKEICEERKVLGKTHNFRVVKSILKSAEAKIAAAFRFLFGSLPKEEKSPPVQVDNKTGKKKKLIHLSESRHMIVDEDDPRFAGIPDGGEMRPQTPAQPSAKEEEDARD